MGVASVATPNRELRNKDRLNYFALPKYTELDL